MNKKKTYDYHNKVVVCWFKTIFQHTGKDFSVKLWTKENKTHVYHNKVEDCWFKTIFQHTGKDSSLKLWTKRW